MKTIEEKQCRLLRLPEKENERCFTMTWLDISTNPIEDKGVKHGDGLWRIVDVYSIIRKRGIA